MARRGSGLRGRGSGQPNPVDVHVGARVRERRTLLGLSQEKLGEALGLTFQQVQKYERGTNRISASRLYDLCHVLDTDMNYFFEDLPDEITREAPGRAGGLPEEARGTAGKDDPLNKRETLELVRAYYRIHDPELRRRLFEMTKALGAMKPKQGA